MSLIFSFWVGELVATHLSNSYTFNGHVQNYLQLSRIYMGEACHCCYTKFFEKIEYCPLHAIANKHKQTLQELIISFWVKICQMATIFSENGIFCDNFPIFENKLCRLEVTQKKILFNFQGELVDTFMFTGYNFKSSLK